MERVNFVVVLLGDNDFCVPLKESLRELVDCTILDCCPLIAKAFILEWVTSYCVRNHIIRGNTINDKDIEESRKLTKSYIEEKLRVEFRDKLPTEMDGSSIDHDMGSVYYDVNLDTIHYL